MCEKALFKGIDHIGINCKDSSTALQNAELFNSLFDLGVTDGKDSVYAGPSIELMKNGISRGTCGHIAVATNDIEKAKSLLESRGFEFDPDSSKYDSSGKLIVIYLKLEIGGFAIHLLQKY
ncbi:MAG: VOC family protein [Spirochaetia bacterium]|nr:VOC family protein [Spirochaetia bacterium]